jgi:hypothetical protein
MDYPAKWSKIIRTSKPKRNDRESRMAIPRTSIPKRSLAQHDKIGLLTFPVIQYSDYARFIRTSSSRFHNALVTSKVHAKASTMLRCRLSNKSDRIPATNSIRNGTAIS